MGTIDDMVGVTMRGVIGEDDGDTLLFEAQDGTEFCFRHHQDCCESVRIEDITGDLSDLVGVPILSAEETSNREETDYGDSQTWTFYHFRTIKGTVTVRWCGRSNGYYSESVSLDITKPGGKTETHC